METVLPEDAANNGCSEVRLLQCSTVLRRRMLTNYSICSILWPELSSTHVHVITSPQYSPICTGCWSGIGLSTRLHWSHSRADDTTTAILLSELIHHYKAPRLLRSRGVNILNFSKRAFCHGSPTGWNSLPQTVISDWTIQQLVHLGPVCPLNCRTVFIRCYTVLNLCSFSSIKQF